MTVKPRPVPLQGAATVEDLMRGILSVRFGEACDLCAALESGDPAGLHQFRIACKRLRYALERFDALWPLFDASARHLALVQDALGEVHDCDLLLAQLPAEMPKTRLRLAADRERCARRSATLWRDARVLLGESLRFVAHGSATPCSASAATPS
ncbi:MAG TPA: CHAD domain-containing protein [Verrucomicrobiae bacterium]|nr:CHAD domain-containing protein [Verrucomicrobiae bacterium]